MPGWRSCSRGGGLIGICGSSTCGAHEDNAGAATLVTAVARSRMAVAAGALRGPDPRERLAEVFLQVFRVFKAEGPPDKPVGDTHPRALFRLEAGMSRRPRMAVARLCAAQNFKE